MAQYDGTHTTVEAEGWSPLMCAAWHGEFYAVEALLEAGANVNARDSEGDTPLLVATQQAKADEPLRHRGRHPPRPRPVGRRPQAAEGRGGPAGEGAVAGPRYSSSSSGS
jgi:hypothetical protein